MVRILNTYITCRYDSGDGEKMQYGRRKNTLNSVMERLIFLQMGSGHAWRHTAADYPDRYCCTIIRRYGRLWEIATTVDYSPVS
jgi:hypothetical protein